jgi:predicted nucleic acid-binding Zn ribbon protein
MTRLPRAPRSDDTLVAVRDAWAEAVGPEVARNAYPVRLTRAGVVVVHCSGASWASELTLLCGHLRAQLEARIGSGTPTEFRFEVGELPQLEQEATAPSVRTPNPRAAELASGVADPELRVTIERAISVRSSAPS